MGQRSLCFFSSICLRFDGHRSPPRISMTDGSQHLLMAQVGFFTRGVYLYISSILRSASTNSTTHLPSDTGGRDTWTSRCLHLLEGGQGSGRSLAEEKE